MSRRRTIVADREREYTRSLHGTGGSDAQVVERPTPRPEPRAEAKPEPAPKPVTTEDQYRCVYCGRQLTTKASKMSHERACARKQRETVSLDDFSQA